MSVVDIAAGRYNKALIEHPQYGRCVIAWNYFSLYYPGNPVYDTLTELYILFTENEGYVQKLYSGWDDCWISCNDGQTWQGGILSEGYYSDNMYIPFDSFSLTDAIDVGCGGADLYFNAFLRADGTIYVFDPYVGVVTNTITDFTDDAWYNFSFADENDATVEGYISGLGSKMEEPSEDIYAIAYEEGDVVWKQYKLSDESWNETGIIYAENPFEDTVVAGRVDFDDIQEQSISMGILGVFWGRTLKLF